MCFGIDTALDGFYSQILIHIEPFPDETLLVVGSMNSLLVAKSVLPASAGMRIEQGEPERTSGLKLKKPGRRIG